MSESPDPRSAADEPDRRRKRRSAGSHGRPERGATLVEYTLLVALLAVATIGGLTLLQDGAENTAQTSADRISTHSIPPTSAP